jgi:hypothetical protein
MFGAFLDEKSIRTYSAFVLPAGWLALTCKSRNDWSGTDTYGKVSDSGDSKYWVFEASAAV